MRFLILGWSVGLKKKPKKNHKKSRNRRPWYPRMTLKVNIYIFGLTKCTICCLKLFLFSLHCPTLIFQIKRIISSEKWFNYVVTSFFFFENAKNLGRSDDTKRRKKIGWPKGCKKFSVKLRAGGTSLLKWRWCCFWKFEIVFTFVQKTLYWDCICVNSAYYNVAVFAR